MAIGTHLVNKSRTSEIEVYYWRHLNSEIDFVIERGKSIIGIEVKSGTANKIAGKEVVQKHCNHSKILFW